MPNSREVPILIVDDEPMILALLEECLHRHGFKTLLAGNGRTALHLVADSEPIQMVITDIQMPEIGGIELLDALRENNPDLPAILISGCCANFSDIREHLDSRTLFIEKPFEFQAIGDTVEELLENADLEAETPASRRRAAGRKRSESRRPRRARPVT